MYLEDILITSLDFSKLGKSSDMIGKQYQWEKWGIPLKFLKKNSLKHYFFKKVSHKKKIRKLKLS